MNVQYTLQVTAVTSDKPSECESCHKEKGTTMFLVACGEFNTRAAAACPLVCATCLGNVLKHFKEKFGLNI